MAALQEQLEYAQSPVADAGGVIMEHDRVSGVPTESPAELDADRAVEIRE